MTASIARRRWSFALLAVALGSAVLVSFRTSLGAAPAFSLAGEPVDLRADRVDVDLGTSTAILEGHVELTRSDLRVSCPRVEARFDKDGRILRAKGAGGVVVIMGPRAIRGEAAEIELDVVARTAELRGNVRVAQGGSTLTAQRASVDLATSRVSLEAVRGTFAAGSAAPPPSPSAAPSAAAPATPTP